MKFLLHSHFPVGHVLPMQAVAQALTGRGHVVLWLASADNEARVRAAGAIFVPTRAIAAIDAPLVREHDSGLFNDCSYQQLKGRVLAQVAEYRVVLDEHHVDALLLDVWPHGARALHELGEIPTFATLGVIPMFVTSASAPLPTTGEWPPVSRSAVVLNAIRHAWNQFCVLPLYLKAKVDCQRASLGLKPLPYGETNEQHSYSPHLHIQASSRTLEFCQDPAPSLHRQHTFYVGPLVAQLPTLGKQLPAWWADTVPHRRVVGVTQGTLAMQPASLIIPSIQALRDESDILLVVVSPHVREIEAQVGVVGNARYAEWLSYDILLPKLSLLITNGGYGSITQALSHAVPLICAGRSEDKKDTGARVAWSGVGLDLKTDNPSPAQVRVATRQILEDAAFQARAAKLGRELNSLGGAEKACDLLEDLAVRCSGKAKF